MKSILVIQLRQLGDILLTTPILRVLRLAYPDAKISFLSHVMGRLVIDDSPFVDQHFTYKTNQRLIDHFSLIKSLRAEKFDIVLDFMGNPRSAFLTLASQGKKRIGFDSVRRWAYHQVYPRPGREEYIVDGKLSLLRALTPSEYDRRLILPWYESHAEVFRSFLSEETVLQQATRRIVLSPTHRRLERRWSLASYAALADRLVRDFKAQVIWLWGPGEEEEIDLAISLTKEISFKAPKTNFREMAALIANCDLFVGNSNGPSHVAVAVDTPSLQLHGPTEGRSWCPDTPRHRFIQRTAMGDIPVSQVWDLIHGLEKEIDLAASRRVSLGMRSRWDTP